MKTKQNKTRAANLGKIDEQLKSKTTIKEKANYVSREQKEREMVSDERVETNLA